MNDFNEAELRQTRALFAIDLLNKLEPSLYTGIQQIVTEAKRMCEQSGELHKFLASIQNLLVEIVKWTPAIIDGEVKRIIAESRCNVLEDLIACVFVTCIKLLTSVRTGTVQRKIEVNIPELNPFIHKVYCNIARRLYSRVQLFHVTRKTTPQQILDNQEQVHQHIRDAILDTILANTPVDAILQAYVTDVNVEEAEHVVEVKEHIVPSSSTTTTMNQSGGSGSSSSTEHNELAAPVVSTTSDMIVSQPTSSDTNISDAKLDQLIDSVVNNNANTQLGVEFDNSDRVMTPNGSIQNINAPKDILTVTSISDARHTARKAAAIYENASNDDDYSDNENFQFIEDGGSSINESILGIVPLPDNTTITPNDNLADLLQFEVLS